MITAKSTYHHQPAKQIITARILNGFDDRSFTEDMWMKLLRQGETDAVNLTWQWQWSWWRTFGRGELLLIVVEQDGEPIALAPLFTDGGMIYNICPEDCLDFIGDISNPAVLDAILETASEKVGNFLGFVFYFIPDTSGTGERLQQAAKRLGMTFKQEGDIPSPWLDIKGRPEKAMEATRKKSLRRHENYFVREGGIEVLHLQKPTDIFPHLNDFFEQHIERRAATNARSIFLNSQQKEYYSKLTNDLGATGWLRFTRINFKGRPIAFHYGLSYNGRYLFGIPSFDINLSEHSPGEVLLRQVLLSAINEGATSFDFGIGDEAYKYRFSTHVTTLYNWGLYP